MTVSGLSVSIRLDAAHDEFRGLVAEAERQLAEGRDEQAAVAVQIAATFAWLNHTGLFADDALEDVLARVGERLPGDAGQLRRPSRSGARRSVLHVATASYSTGGHTQMISRWLDQDTDSRHRICLTRQGPGAVPAKLLDRIHDPRDLLILDRHRGGLLTRAAALRAAARDVDIVLLHVHPNDVVPSIAFAVDGLPPVVTVNHADHVFWIGRGVTTAVLNLRESGRVLTIDRRGIAPARSLVMTRPLTLPQRTIPRDEVKQRWGLAPDQVLLVTAAAASKYEPISAPGFMDLVVPVLQRHPDAVLLAAGPDPTGRWVRAAADTGGRVRALGRLPDVTPLHQAADIYLDSYPFGSLTSLLEAGSLGSPAVTFRGHPDDCLVLGSDTAGVDKHLITPATADEFGAALDMLIRDAGRRRALGERTAATIVDTHVGDGWRAGLARFYSAVADLAVRPPRPGVGTYAAGSLDALVDLVQLQTGHGNGRRGAELGNLALLPVRERVRVWTDEARSSRMPSVRLLLPEWAGNGVSRALRSARERRRPQGPRGA